MSTDELLAEALRLTRVDRARVAEELLSSLEEPDDEVAAAWATELERRSREVAEGRVQPTSWPTARTEILKELEQRRASEVSAALDRIAEVPESHQPWPRTRASGATIRKATVHRFPYVIAVEKHEQHVLVLAVAHVKRRPLYWLTRANP